MQKLIMCNRCHETSELIGEINSLEVILYQKKGSMFTDWMREQIRRKKSLLACVEELECECEVIEVERQTLFDLPVE